MPPGDDTWGHLRFAVDARGHSAYTTGKLSTMISDRVDGRWQMAKRLSFVLAGVIAVVAMAATVGIDAGETPKTIRIIYTNDLSGDLKGCE
jgi:hypothetical protein